MEKSRMPRNVYEPLKVFMQQTYFLKVNINCHGCNRKVKKTLRKVEGVYSVDIDTDQQAVIVRGNLDPEILVTKLNRRGKYAELLFMSPFHGNHHDNRSLRNAPYNFGNNHFNNVPSYERQSDGEMMKMMMANNMKPVMMNEADYFQMSDSSEDFQELFGETAQRHNYDEEVHPNLMRDMDLGYSNAYPAAETMNMHIPGRSNNTMMNERSFHGQMMNGPSLVPQFMNQEQFSARQLNGFYY
uniref:HMA domain-containing protein n=1 Tax=Brassica campestris TaxID=3711 RepID=M4EH91_BRACM|nr:unnamed protein product [Brassica rapa]